MVCSWPSIRSRIDHEPIISSPLPVKQSVVCESPNSDTNDSIGRQKKISIIDGLLLFGKNVGELAGISERLYPCRNPILLQ
jgi:hypothetical protein